MNAAVAVSGLTGDQRLDLGYKRCLRLWPTAPSLSGPSRRGLHREIGACHAERIGDRLHGVPARAGEGERNSRFFGCTRSSASRRISFSRVFLPSSRCSSLQCGCALDAEPLRRYCSAAEPGRRRCLEPGKCPEDVGRARPLIVRCRGACPALRPPPGDLVLLSDPGLVLKPDFYRLACRVALGDLVEADGEIFLNAASAAAS